MKVLAFIRKKIGTKSSRKLRNFNNVPGIIYGENKKPQNIFINHNFLYSFLHKESFYSFILEIEILGKVEFVLLKDFQFHAYKKKVLHVDFQRINFKKKVNIKVPLHFINLEISPIKKVSSGVINYILTDILITCLPKYLPKFIEVDLSKLESGQSIYLMDLILPNGVNIFSKNNSLILNTNFSEKNKTDLLIKNNNEEKNK